MPTLPMIEAFVAVAEHGSFRTAGARLGVDSTAVSKAVGRLEDELGTVLLARTTRTVALTDEGATYLGHCRAALDRLRAGEDAVRRAGRVAEGVVRASLSSVLARIVVRALPRLFERYPGIDLRLSFTDRNVGLVSEDIDIAVRIGALTDSSLVARRLRTPSWVTVASPALLARSGAVTSLSDLQAHRCLVYATTTGSRAPWRFLKDGTEVLVRPDRTVLVDAGDILLEAARAGVGLAQVMDFMAAADLERGDLVEVLPHTRAPGPPIHALYTPGRGEVPRLRAFLDFLVETLGR